MNLTPARILVPVFLVGALALTGCSGSNDDDGGGSTSESYAGDAKAAIADDAGGDQSAAEPGTAADTAQPQQQALIRKGDVALRAEDVDGAQRKVQRVVDRYSGQVSDEDTQSDDDGRASYTRMVLRIPTADFSKAVAELKRAGDELESAKTTQKEVSDEIIDVQTRVSVQKRSIARISVLFQQAENIRDIMAIEAELSQRQADLESLEQQAAYLASETSMSTVVVSIDEIVKAGPKPKKTDDAGFLAGLDAGWEALAGFAVGLATVAGLLLPWLVACAIVGIPVLLLVRSLRRRTTLGGPTGEAAQSSE